MDIKGYNKDEVNEFVDYVIKKTEENILTIKNQKDEIERLQKENERLKHLEDTYRYVQINIENTKNEIKSNALREADLIIKEAKDNASLLINDALLKTKEIKQEEQRIKEITKSYKTRVQRILKEEIEILNDIEIL